MYLYCFLDLFTEQLITYRGTSVFRGT